MKPMYFGQTPKKLFGVHHPPLTNRSVRTSAIILCYPMAHEYLYVHRAFRQLAIQLSRVGFHVLRFDYYGFGDSFGESEETDVEQWIMDISTAIEEAKNASGRQLVSLIGLRLGATAAAIAASRRSDVENIVLWEPVVDGAKYLKELSVLQTNWSEENLPHNGHFTPINGNFEFMGNPLSARMRNALENIDLRKSHLRLATNILLAENGKPVDRENLRITLTNLFDDVKYQQFPAIDAWNGAVGLDSVYVPGETLAAIVSWLSKVSS